MMIRNSKFPRDISLAAAAGRLALLVSIQPFVCAQPFWPQFRGPNGQGVAEGARPPVVFDAGHALAWKTPVGIGHSSPCVWGDHLFLTVYEQGALACRAHDRNTGRPLWTGSVPAESIEPTHAFSNPAAPTPAADARRVIAYFGSYGMVCWDHDGHEAWRRPFPAPMSRGKYGSASSPIITGDRVVQLIDSNEGRSRLVALDAATGAIVWDQPRPLCSAGWSTPVVSTLHETRELVVLGSKLLVAYDPDSGKERWSLGGFPAETVAVPALGEGLLFAGGAAIGGRANPTFDLDWWDELVRFDRNGDGRLEPDEMPGDHRIVQRPELPDGHPGRLLPFPPRALIRGMDSDKDGSVDAAEWRASMAAFESRDTPVLMAVRPGGSTLNAEERVVWEHHRGIPEIPSPLYYRGKLYLIRDGGILTCHEAASGIELYSKRIGVPGGYCASPIAADGRIYIASQSGTIVVLDATEAAMKVLARNRVGEPITATPALAGNTLYVRGAEHLLAFVSDAPALAGP